LGSAVKLCCRMYHSGPELRAALKPSSSQKLWRSSHQAHKANDAKVTAVRRMSGARQTVLLDPPARVMSKSTSAWQSGLVGLQSPVIYEFTGA
jgi:hypothetical protein